MMYRLILSMLLLGSGFAQATVVVLAADPWCPYNCQPETDYPGYLVEVARKVLEPHGYKVKYINLPWNRSIRMTRAGAIDGIIGAGKDEVPDFIFPSLALHRVKHSFFSKHDSQWEFSNNESLQGKRLGVIKDYSYGQFHEGYIKQHEGDSDRLTVVYNAEGFPQLSRLLQADRIDLLIEAEGVAKNYMKKQGLPNWFRFAGVASEEDIYISFSPALPNSRYLAQLLSKGYQAFRATDEHRQLLQKYMLTEQINFTE